MPPSKEQAQSLPSEGRGKHQEVHLRSTLKPTAANALPSARGAKSVPGYGGAPQLTRALQRLQAALGAHEKTARRAAIDGLSTSLRSALLLFMEACHAAKPVSFRSNGSRTADSPSAKVKQSLRPTGVKTGAASRVVDGPPGGQTAMAKRRCLGGVWTVNTGRTQYYKVRCYVAGIVIRSGGFRNMTQAEELLNNLRTSIAAASPQEDDARLHSVAAVLRADLLYRGCRSAPSFAAVLDARRWLGRNIESPSQVTLEQAIGERRRAFDAEKAGWHSVRSLWLEWLGKARPRRWGHKPLDAQEATAAVAAADERAQQKDARMAARTAQRAAKAEAFLARRRRAEARAAHASQLRCERLKRELCKAVARAERALNQATAGRKRRLNGDRVVPLLQRRRQQVSTVKPETVQ